MKRIVHSSKDAPAATVNPSTKITSPGKTGADPVPKSNCTGQSCYDRAINYAKIITLEPGKRGGKDRKSTRLNSSHPSISYAVFCLKKKKKTKTKKTRTPSLR